MGDEFKKRILKGYDTGPAWVRIGEMFDDNDKLGNNAAVIPYRLDDAGLIYYKDPDQGDRLCVLVEHDLIKEVFLLGYEVGWRHFNG